MHLRQSTVAIRDRGREVGLHGLISGGRAMGHRSNILRRLWAWRAFDAVAEPVDEGLDMTF